MLLAYASVRKGPHPRVRILATCHLNPASVPSTTSLRGHRPQLRKEAPDIESLTRRGLVRGGSAAALTTATLAAVSTAAAPTTAAAAHVGPRRSSPFLPYGQNSYFRSTILDAPVDSQRTRAFRSFMDGHPEQNVAYPLINGVDGNEWGTAYAMGQGHHPVWMLEGEHDPKADTLFRRGFHAPHWLGEMITGTNDSPLCVVDRASGFTLFCANAEVVGRRRIRATAAAVTFHSSNGLDYRNPRSDDRRNFTSRGRISDAMVIRKDLVRYGVATDTDLGHVLHLFLVETLSSDGFRHPMVGAEGEKYGFGAEGERLAISPRVDLTKRGLSSEGLVVARTLQRFGCYLGDNSGSASALKAQQENASRPLWRGQLRRDSLRGIRWDDFVVLKGRRQRPRIRGSRLLARSR